MQFHRHSVMLLCSDIQEAKRFYTKHLKLESNAELDWFIGLQRSDPTLGAFELSLCDANHGSLPPTIRHPSTGLVMAFEVENIDHIYTEMQTNGVSMLTPPTDEPWGQRHFFAAAPDGVALDIFQAIAPDPEWMKANGFG